MPSEAEDSKSERLERDELNHVATKAQEQEQEHGNQTASFPKRVLRRLKSIDMDVTTALLMMK
jgi:hypothetical protein